MKRILGLAAAAAVSAALTGVSNGDMVRVVGGETSVALDFDLLSTAAGLNLSSVSPGVITPGNIADSVAFNITSPTSGNLPTTFNYDSDDFFNTFNGTIEHRGAIFFNDDSIAVGNFTIGFRETGFYVGSNFGAELVLFDVANIDPFASAETVTVAGDLLVSNEFALFLLDAGLATSDLTGADVGDAFVQGYTQSVPAPGVLAALGMAGCAIRRRRR